MAGAPMSVRTYLVYGLVAGFCAGLLAFAVAASVGEPPVAQAIAFEEGGAAPADHSHPAGEDTVAHSHGDQTAQDHGADEVVSRANQSTWGLLTGVLATGVAVGGVLGLVSAFAAGRLGRLRPAASSAVVAALSFVVFYGVQWVKYPPNPPAVGRPETLGARTAMYFGMMVISLALMVGAVHVSRLGAPRIGSFAAVASAVVFFVVGAVVAGILMPSVDEVPAEFPADTLFAFRVASLLVELTLFTTIGLVLGTLVERRYRVSPTPAADPSRSVAAVG